MVCIWSCWWDFSKDTSSPSTTSSWPLRILTKRYKLWVHLRLACFSVESHPGVLCWVSLRGGGVDSQPKVQAAHLGHIQQAQLVPNGHVAPGCICNLPLHRKRISGVMCGSLLISSACVWISEITALGPSTIQFWEIIFFLTRTPFCSCTSRCQNMVVTFFLSAGS